MNLTGSIAVVAIKIAGPTFRDLMGRGRRVLITFEFTAVLLLAGNQAEAAS